MQEGENSFTSTAFYREVAQEMILFMEETWVLPEDTEKRIAGLHMEFFQKVTGKQAKRRLYGTWCREVAENVLKATWTQGIQTYIDRCQKMVAQWVALRPIVGADGVHRRRGGDRPHGGSRWRRMPN